MRPIVKKQKTDNGLSLSCYPLALNPLSYMVEEIRPCLLQIQKEIEEHEQQYEYEDDDDEDEEDNNDEKNKWFNLFKDLNSNPHPYALHMMDQWFGHGKNECTSSILWMYEDSEFIVRPILPKVFNARFHWYHGKMAYLSRNQGNWAVDWLAKHPRYIQWDHLSANPHPKAVLMLKANIKKINWHSIQTNPNPDAFALFQEHCQLPISTWNKDMCMNPAAFALLDQHKDKLMTTLCCGETYHEHLCLNTDDRVIEWYKDNPHHIVWESLCRNPCDTAVQLILRQATNNELDMLEIESLIQNPRREILQLVVQHWSTWTWPNDDWTYDATGKLLLTTNPAIFQGYDYHLHHLFGSKAWDYRPFLKERMKTTGLAEELAQNRFHPRHMDKWHSWGHEDEQDFV